MLAANGQVPVLLSSYLKIDLGYLIADDTPNPGRAVGQSSQCLSGLPVAFQPTSCL